MIVLTQDHSVKKWFWRLMLPEAKRREKGVANELRRQDESAARTLSYNSIGAAASNHSHKMFEFTYVVDSDQKLEDWANNVAGNDYTSVLIRKGTWTLNIVERETPVNNFYAFNLTATGTKAIVEEVGSKIIINRNTVSTGYRRLYAFYYNSKPTSNDYYIYGVTLEANLGSEMTSGGWAACYGLYRCININNCIVMATSTVTGSGTGSMEANAYCFYNCDNIHNCSGSTSCSSVKSEGFAYAFYNCTNMSESSGNAQSTHSDQTNTNDFKDCKAVRYCKSVNDTYITSYSSPTADPTYACANTLEGGWNI